MLECHQAHVCNHCCRLFPDHLTQFAPSVFSLSPCQCVTDNNRTYQQCQWPCVVVQGSVMILQSLYWGPHKNRLQTINCCTNAEGKHGMTDGGMGTYFSARLIQSPDTPPASGSKTPSPRWRSARWNMLVHTDHTLGSGTCGCGTAARREPPSQVITPPDSTPDEPVCVSIYCVCS